ncbi:chromosomal replication initiator protein DnaA [Fervidobacterium gondwanense]|uniref:Chromosomal replication initiator protein DnaA n=1 Tax=Fervidobacterium gondwanense DSM 13020 TaxID=1121883 RepID=A0A1M7RVH4_FERGO|nr:chromosomal replication initiator protein DnaA [Fervidobacterium gondwanense]SHN50315.1 chromosomal replication initiator protein DnaA [Fervidobacterium gondwanense DSM 13020]
MNKEKLLSLLKEKVSRQQWEHWFIDFSVKRIEENHVVFEVGNLFIKGYIEKKFDKILRKVVGEVLGPGATYEIVDAPISLSDNSEIVSDNVALVRKKPVLITPLNPKYTFDNFVVDEFNQFAYNVLLEAAKKPGTYNPIFIHSEAGMGKTHLVQAYGNYLLSNNPDLRYAYLTSESFMNELVTKLKTGNMEEFRERYRKKIDVLVIDDIQFLAGKKGVQIELFHTFNTLYESGKQIIVCSDRSPKELKEFQDRVISRFQMGIVVQIKTPSQEAMYKISKKIVDEEKADVPDEVLEYVARHLKGSIRILKGAVVKLIAYKSMYGEVTVSTAKSILKDVLIEDTRSTDHDILDAASKIFGVSKEELVSNSRDKKTAMARQLCMYLMVRKFGMSTRKVGEIFSKSHPAVISAVKNIEEKMQEDKRLIGHMKLIEIELQKKAGNASS